MIKVHREFEKENGLGLVWKRISERVKIGFADEPEIFVAVNNDGVSFGYEDGSRSSLIEVKVRTSCFLVLGKRKQKIRPHASKIILSKTIKCGIIVLDNKALKGVLG